MNDLLITWHESCDYPIFRYFIEKHHDHFNKIIIYFSKHFREPYLSGFLKESLHHIPNIQFLDPIEYKYGLEDWRNIATNYMLKHSTSEWVCSIEQDFFTKDWSALLKKSNEFMNECDMFGFMNGTIKPYVHPSFWFIKRAVLEKTSKDFSAHPEINGCDHFGMITYDVQSLGIPIVSIDDKGIKTDIKTPDTTDAFHLGGVNQNYLSGISQNYFHRPDIFSVYNEMSARTPVIQSPLFMNMINDVRRVLPYKEGSGWEVFFT